MTKTMNCLCGDPSRKKVLGARVKHSPEGCTSQTLSPDSEKCIELTRFEARVLFTAIAAPNSGNNSFSRQLADAVEKLWKFVEGPLCYYPGCSKAGVHKTRRGFTACEEHKTD